MEAKRDMTTVRMADVLANPEQFDGQEIQLAGWVRTIRDQKHFAFIDLNDGSSFSGVQIVATREHLPAYDQLVALGSGASLLVRGVLKLTPSQKQACELQAQHFEVMGASDPHYPLQPKRHSPEFLRTIPHLRPRTRLFNAVYRVRSEAAFQLHRFFHERGFMYVQTPLITSIDAEGAGDMFRVSTLDPQHPPLNEAGQVDWSQDFFGSETSLTVTGQFHAEAFAQAFSKVYTFGPTFRAEHSNTTRHAAEFWMLEPEIAFAELEDVMQLAEDMLRYLLKAIMQSCPTELAFFNQFVSPGLLERLQLVIDKPFERMTYTEAVQALEQSGQKFQYPVHWGMDLQTEHERYLTEQLVGGPLFVTDYPKEIKAFYMRQNEDGKTVAACDCLVPGVGEIVGGSQREERLDRLIARMEELEMKREPLEWYLDLRRYGSTKHGGFGLGFERILMYLTGVANIRDVALFPRTFGSAEF